MKNCDMCLNPQLIFMVNGIIFHGAVSDQCVIVHQGPINPWIIDRAYGNCSKACHIQHAFIFVLLFKTTF